MSETKRKLHHESQIAIQKQVEKFIHRKSSFDIIKLQKNQLKRLPKFRGSIDKIIVQSRAKMADLIKERGNAYIAMSRQRAKLNKVLWKPIVDIIESNPEFARVSKDFRKLNNSLTHSSAKQIRKNPGEFKLMDLEFPTFDLHFDERVNHFDFITPPYSNSTTQGAGGQFLSADKNTGELRVDAKAEDDSAYAAAGITMWYKPSVELEVMEVRPLSQYDYGWFTEAGLYTSHSDGYFELDVLSFDNKGNSQKEQERVHQEWSNGAAWYDYNQGWDSGFWSYDDPSDNRTFIFVDPNRIYMISLWAKCSCDGNLADGRITASIPFVVVAGVKKSWYAGPPIR